MFSNESFYFPRERPRSRRIREKEKKKEEGKRKVPSGLAEPRSIGSATRVAKRFEAGVTELVVGR